jgi:hypothetical protein
LEDRVPAICHRTGHIATLLVIALFAMGCVGQTTPTLTSATPDARPSIQTGSPSQKLPTRTPSTVPTAVAPPTTDLGCAAMVKAVPSRHADPTPLPNPSPTIAGSDAQSVAAIGKAAEQLAALRSFRFSVDVVGRDLSRLEPSALDFALRGTVSRASGFAMDALLATRMRETNGTDASITSSTRLVAGDEYVWWTDNASGVLEPSLAASTIAGFSLLTPDGVAGRVVVPFAGGYRRVGTEKHGGVMTVHYRASTRGAAAYASALRFDGDVKADLWIASDSGYLAALKIAGTGGHLGVSNGVVIDDLLLIAFEVSRPDDAANIVELPVAPLPDPVRPNGPSMDLQLVYQVMPSNGVTATPRDLDDITVTLRTRLDVSARPVRVNVEGDDRIVVTICNTTRGPEDRRLIVAPGALAVVPLPASQYGSTAKPGPRALPPVGGPVDPALEPVAPAARVSLTRAHVDPTTGRRGVAFGLGNEAAEIFRMYAAAHPGEYVAIVLDGVVLATLPIDEQVAQGHFAFTGDYTEAETRLLAQSLYRDPLRFELRPIEDIEVPSTAR